MTEQQGGNGASGVQPLSMGQQLVRTVSRARDSLNANLEPFAVSVHHPFSKHAQELHETDSDASQESAKSAASAAARQPALSKRLAALAEGKLRPEQMLWRDQIAFFLGVVNLVLTAYWTGRSPETLYKWFTVKAIVLYSARFYIYRKKRWGYYMLEFCYAANVFLLLEIWLFPRSPTFHKVTFGLVAGPLTWSIVALRNSLVLHSLDKITSLFMHASPALVAWCWRWYPDQRRLRFDTMSKQQQHAYNTLTWYDLLVLSMGAYMLWVVAYYVKVFVISARKVKEEGYQTLYMYMTKNPRTLFARAVLSAPEALRPAVYMGIHATMCLLAIVTAKAAWESWSYHTIFLLVCLAVSAWNGATYYFSPKFRMHNIDQAPKSS